MIDQERLPHLLFYGPPGTGKTTTILACARKIYGANFKKMILELNASDDRGIKTVRDVIKGTSQYSYYLLCINLEFINNSLKILLGLELCLEGITNPS